MEALAWLMPLAVAWAVAVWFFRSAGAWLPYYVLASAGSALLIVFASREIVPIEFGIRASTAFAVHHLAGLVGIQTDVVRTDPGAILIVGVRHGNEWTHLNVGLETSGLLEGAALFGLVAFFPAQGGLGRVAVVLLALAASFGANILRVMIIVTIVAYQGQGLLDLAHIVLGRIVFFALAIGIYWLAITKPTLRTVGARLKDA